MCCTSPTTYFCNDVLENRISECPLQVYFFIIFFLSQLNQFRKDGLQSTGVKLNLVLFLNSWLKPVVSLLQSKTSLPVSYKRKPKAKEEETKY